MTEYAMSDIIRVGREFVKTGVLAEATPRGSLTNLLDMSQYDADDLRLAIVLGPLEMDVAQAYNVNIDANDRVYYIEVADAKACGAEIKLVDSGSGITAGNIVRVTTAGDVVAFAYGDGTEETDLMRDCLGVAMETVSANGNVWVKFGSV